MISASDVRIGNLVWYYDYNMIETTFRIEGIMDGCVYNSGLPKSRLPFEKVNPIDLDADHVTEFGFLQGDSDYGEDPDVYEYRYNHKDSVYIRDEGNAFQPVTRTDKGFASYGKPIHHLHQLQNLFYDLTRDEVFIS